MLDLIFWLVVAAVLMFCYGEYRREKAELEHHNKVGKEMETL